MGPDMGPDFEPVTAGLPGFESWVAHLERDG